MDHRIEDTASIGRPLELVPVVRILALRNLLLVGGQVEGGHGCLVAGCAQRRGDARDVEEEAATHDWAEIGEGEPANGSILL